MPLVPGSMALFRGNGSSVTVAGTVRAPGGIDVSGSGTTAIDGGAIDLGDTAAAGLISVAAGTEAAIGSELLGSGGLIKTGAGRLTLSGVNRVTGRTRLDGGTLAVTTAAAAPTGSLTVATGRLVVDSSLVEQFGVATLEIDAARGGGIDLGFSRMTVAAGGITEADLRGDISAGRNTGRWDGGSGITS